MWVTTRLPVIARSSNDAAIFQRITYSLSLSKGYDNSLRCPFDELREYFCLKGCHAPAVARNNGNPDLNYCLIGITRYRNPSSAGSGKINTGLLPSTRQSLIFADVMAETPSIT